MRQQQIQHWHLCGYNNYVPLFEKSREVDAQTKGVTFDMEIETPHSIYDALLEYGYIEDPYFEMNSTKCEWVANRWWEYTTTVTVDEICERMELVFEGLDYRAHIYLNTQEIGLAENAFIHHVYDVSTLLKKGENTLRVILEHAPDEMGQIGYSNRVFTQKPKFNYKWDFCTRLISLGIHKPVYLRFGEKCKIDNVRFHQGEDVKKPCVTVSCENFSQDCMVVIEFDGKRYETNDISKPIVLSVENPRLWYPNGAGEQALYDLFVTLYRGELAIDAYHTKVGIRSFCMQHNDNATDALPYVFTVNGKKIYGKGVNITPLDQTCYTPNERYDQFLALLKQANVNLIRVWGGGVIESEYFYSQCDKLGFMVLQDFPQSSCGINNGTCKDEAYLQNFAKTAIFACKALRNHPSLVAFDGGNEMISPDWMPLTEEDEVLKMLGDIVREHCGDRHFYPTTPSGLSVNGDITRKGVNHDIHGPWQYYPNHYEYYNAMDSLLHSEVGVDGMANLESLEKFLSAQNLHVSNATKNLVWRHHGEWWDTYKRDCAIFGEPKNLQEQIQNSQRVQAEGLRYILEANRRRAFQNSGTIIWQANECYPNVNSTSLIDFYMQPKPVLEQVAKAYAPLNVSLKYDKWVLKKDEEIDLEIFAVSDKSPMQTDVQVEIINGSTITKHAYTPMLGDGRSVRLAHIRVKAKENLSVRLLAENEADTFENVLEFVVK